MKTQTLRIQWPDGRRTTEYVAQGQVESQIETARQAGAVATHVLQTCEGCLEEMILGGEGFCFTHRAQFPR